MHGAACVVGVGESAYYVRGRSPDSEFQLAITAIRNAVADAGLELSEVDGFVSYMDSRNDPPRLAAALGVKRLRWAAQAFGGGGNNAAAAVQLADAAVSAGYARHVVAFRSIAQGQFGRFGQAYLGRARPGPGRVGGNHAYSALYGLLSPAQECALHTRRFMHDHGISQEALCDITLACYANAQRNPRALRHGRPLTREQYHASRWIVEPFHLFDCCPENDGAAAVVVTTAERARDLQRAPVAIVAAAQGRGPSSGVAAYQAPWFPGVFYRGVAEDLWQRAGCRPADCDVVQFYENFSGPVMMALCELGFCAPDEVEAFVADGALEGPKARLPFNTSGGNIGEAYIHGFELVNEAVRQVRGESTCQVERVERSLMVAGPGYSPGSAVLFGGGGLMRVLGEDWLLPALDERNHDWFTSGKLELRECRACGTLQFPPEDVCTSCQGAEFGTRASAGRGRIESVAVAHHPVHPALAGAVPYAIVVVSLDDAPGVHLIGNVRGREPDRVEIGQAVRLVFEELPDPDGGEVLRIPQWEVA